MTDVPPKITFMGGRAYQHEPPNKMVPLDMPLSTHTYMLDTGTLRETVECKSCHGSGKDVRYLEDTRDDTCGMCLGTGRRVKPND